MRNQKLRFTFGHILAYISLIFIGYISFLGLTYWGDGNFILSGILTGVMVLILLGLMTYLQGLKAVARYFKIRIKIERICLLIFILFSIISSLPFLHFWTVFSNEDVLSTSFSKSIDKSKAVFDAYEIYANNRVQVYTNDLDRVIRAKNNSPSQYVNYGFMEGKDDNFQKEKKIDKLRGQHLLSENYDNIKVPTIDWLDKARSNANVWNPFFLNNVKTISSVISDKITELHKMSETLCPNESAEPFAYSITFEDVTNLYTIFNRTPALIGLLLAIICYALLLFPYALQTRNTKSTYTLVKYSNK